jgi:hypothetical protein
MPHITNPENMTEQSQKQKDADALANDKQTHGASRTQDAAASFDYPDTGSQRPQKSPDDNLGATTPNPSDESTEETETGREVAEEQGNDRANAEANRARLDSYRDDSEWEVNPDQTPKPAKTIRPIDYV